LVPVIAELVLDAMHQRFAAGVARDTDPFEGQCFAHYPPTVAGLAEDVAGKGLHIV